MEKKLKLVGYAMALKSAGIDLSKNYFSLTHREQKIVEKVCDECGYNYVPTNGRTITRQFYYTAQKAIKK